MLKEKAGEIAGKIWNALNETEGLTGQRKNLRGNICKNPIFA